MLKTQRLLARRPLQQPRKQSLRALKPRDRAHIGSRSAAVLATRGLPITIHQRQRRLAHRIVSLPGADEQVQQIRSHATTSVSRSGKDITPLTFDAAHRGSSRKHRHNPARKRRPTRYSPDKTGLSTHYKRPAPIRLRSERRGRPNASGARRANNRNGKAVDIGELHEPLCTARHGNTGLADRTGACTAVAIRLPAARRQRPPFRPGNVGRQRGPTSAIRKATSC